MTAQKPTSPGKPAATQATPLTSTAASSRKPWIKKTPVEIVLEQIGKQEEGTMIASGWRVEGMVVDTLAKRYTAPDGHPVFTNYGSKFSGVYPPATTARILLTMSS